MTAVEAMYLRALAGYEKAWGPGHRKASETGYALAFLFEQKLMVQDVAKHFELVKQGYSKLLGPEHSETVDVSDRLRCCINIDINGNHEDGDFDSDGGGGNDGSQKRDG